MPVSLLAERQTVDAWMQAGWIALGIGLLLPLALFVLGKALGRFTLAIARRSGSRGFARVLGWLGRQLYRLVVIVSILYFYVCIPLILFGSLALVASAVYGLFLIPARMQSLTAVRLVLFVIVFFIVATFLPVIIATFLGSPPKRREQQRYLSYDEAPLLWQVINETARTVGTRPVNVICVLNNSNMGVVERGGLRQRLRGKTDRELLLGLGALPGMTQSQFQAILAHEYGHFSNHDTAGGNWVFRTHVSFYETELMLQEQESDTHIFIVSLILLMTLAFVEYYQRYVFFPMTIGAARLQELMADHYAAAAYGGENFASGLTYIIRQEIVFNIQVTKARYESVKTKKGVGNFYSLPPLDAEAEAKVTALVEQALKRPPSRYDTHPAANERIRLIAAVNSDKSILLSNEPVWSLLRDPQSLQVEMTRRSYRR